MEFSEHAKRLRILVSEHDHCGPKPLYEAIVLKARELGLAGATVTKGMMGYGGHSHLHWQKVLRDRNKITHKICWSFRRATVLDSGSDSPL